MACHHPQTSLLRLIRIAHQFGVAGRVLEPRCSSPLLFVPSPTRRELSAPSAPRAMGRCGFLRYKQHFIFFFCNLQFMTFNAQISGMISRRFTSWKACVSIGCSLQRPCFTPQRLPVGLPMWIGIQACPARSRASSLHQNCRPHPTPIPNTSLIILGFISLSRASAARFASQRLHTPKGTFIMQTSGSLPERRCTKPRLRERALQTPRALRAPWAPSTAGQHLLLLPSFPGSSSGMSPRSPLWAQQRLVPSPCLLQALGHPTMRTQLPGAQGCLQPGSGVTLKAAGCR